VTILVTGGAGYIGSHVVRLLHERGDAVVVVDDLSSGSRARAGDAPVVDLDLAAPTASHDLADVMREHDVTGVVHFAAKKQVAESVARPTFYYRQNVTGLVNLLDAMHATDVERLVFSSSAAVYGDTHEEQVREDSPTFPVNPYGETKLVGEWVARDAAAAWGLRFVGLRYFNVAGAGWPELADPGAANLVPLVMQRIEAGAPPLVFGDDYPTPDGSCVRDYIHVLDLAEAHLAALRHAEDAGGAPGRHDVFNIGTGTGASVFEVIRAFSAVVGREIEPEVAPRRPGDPPRVVASTERAEQELGWRARLGLDTIVRSAWDAR
jgi:UDP-glucose 4-epimerase